MLTQETLYQRLGGTAGIVAIVNDVVTAHLAHKLRQPNLSLSAFTVLLILSRSEGQGCPLFELSELLIVSRANVTGLVDCLEQRGLLARVVTEGDRRVKRATITAAGEDLLRQLLPDHYTELRAACPGRESREKTLLVELLTNLRRGVQAATVAKAKEK